MKPVRQEGPGGTWSLLERLGSENLLILIGATLLLTVVFVGTASNVDEFWHRWERLVGHDPRVVRMSRTGRSVNGTALQSMPTKKQPSTAEKKEEAKRKKRAIKERQRLRTDGVSSGPGYRFDATRYVTTFLYSNVMMLLYGTIAFFVLVVVIMFIA